eukprot:c19165_g1_i1 orf=294-1571(-)
MVFFLPKIVRKRKTPKDMTLSDFSSKSVLDSQTSWTLPKKEGDTTSVMILAKDVVSAFGSCFTHHKKEESDFQRFKGLSVNSTYTDRSANQSLGPSSSEQGLESGNGAVTFTFAELLTATRNFCPAMKIGQGGFGTVYKGSLRDGRVVAVKRAKKSPHDAHLSAEFRNEVSTLSKVEHLNLVKFIGYLEEADERILVVEYVPNGNLRQHLDVHYGVVLDLSTRLDIAIDVAHALTYLHLYAGQSIIHRDVKSSNILLTENYRAKVADLGFSRLSAWDLDATHISTQVKGTAGYLDPEYLKTYRLTQKSDVYSFGVLLVEIITGRRPIEQKRDPKERVTMRWAFQMFIDGNALGTLDPKLHKTPAANLMVEKLLELAFQCAAPSKHERPSMKRTAEILWNIRKDCNILIYGECVNSSRESPISPMK